MEDAKGGIWLYVTSIAFSLGVAISSFFEVGLPEIGLLFLAALTLAVLLHQREYPLAPGLLMIGIIAGMLGLWRMDLAESRVVDPLLESLVGSEVTLNGVIGREPEDRESSTHLYVKTDQGLILVTAPRGGEWRYGDRVRFTGEIEKPEPFETDLGRTFNYPGYLLAKGVAYTVKLAEMEKVGEGGGFMVISLLLDGKHRFMGAIERLLPEPAAGLGEGLLLGVKRALGEDLENTFRETGIIHIVVLSGYNIMIVVAFVMFVLGSLLGRRVSTFFGIIGIAAFALTVGLGASVVRASIMASLLLALGATGRVYLVLRGLSLAGLVMILINPYVLAFDVGFQLSFLATMGLIFVAPHLEDYLQSVPNKWLAVREFLVATLATQFFVMPLLLYQIGEFSVVAVIVNVLVLPMVAIAMLLTFVTGISGLLIGGAAAPLAFVTYLSLTYIIEVAKWFGSLPFAAFTVPAFPFWLVPLGYALIGLLLWYLNRRTDGFLIRQLEKDPSS